MMLSRYFTDSRKRIHHLVLRWLEKPCQAIDVKGLHLSLRSQQLHRVWDDERKFREGQMFT